MNIGSSLISLAVGLVIPALVSLVTHEKWSDALKALLTAALSALSGGLNGALSSTPHGWHQWEQILWQIAIAWIAAGVVYLTGYKPTGASAWIHHVTDPVIPGPHSLRAPEPPEPSMPPAGPMLRDTGASSLAALLWLSCAAIIGCVVMVGIRPRLWAPFILAAGILLILAARIVSVMTRGSWHPRE